MRKIKRKIQQIKSDFILNYYTNPKKILIKFSILLFSIIFLSLLIITKLYIDSITLLKDKEKLLQEKEKEIKELREILPLYYEEPKIKLNSLSEFQKQKLKEIVNYTIQKNLTTVLEQHKLLNYKEITPKEREKLLKKYNISSIQNKKEILEKIHPIPVKLVIVQAMAESSLGKDKLSSKRNNFWGIMEFKKRSKPRVQHFSSINEGINKYFEILNTGKIMNNFRKIRFQSKGKDFNGMSKALDDTWCQTPNLDYGKILIKIKSKIFQN